MAADVTTRFLTRDEYPHWAELVAGSPEGSPYSLGEYLDALAEATGGNSRVLVAERGGQIVGGVGLYEERRRWGAVVSPRLLLYYNGIVLVPHGSTYPSHVTTWQLHALGQLEKSLSQLPHARLRLKSRHPFRDARIFRAEGWSVQPTYSYEVDIADLPAAWERVDKDQRRNITRCADEGLTMTCDEDFDSFHRLHLQTHERKGAPLYLPREAFRKFVARLHAHKLCRLYHARLPDGRAIASQLVLASAHPVTHTVCAGADAEFLNLGASAFLRWKVFEQLSADGYQANDLTDAALNPVTRFKSQLGGDLMLSLEVWRRDRLALRVAEGAERLARGGARRALRVLRPKPRGAQP